MDTNGHPQSRENHEFETRSFPRSLAATHRGFPSISLIPSARFTDTTYLGSARGPRVRFGGLAETLMSKTRAERSTRRHPHLDRKDTTVTPLDWMKAHFSLTKRRPMLQITIWNQNPSGEAAPRIESNPTIRSAARAFLPRLSARSSSFLRRLVGRARHSCHPSDVPALILDRGGAVSPDRSSASALWAP